MDLLAKLPEMADVALTTLLSNAERLERSGTSAQQRAATALLPAVKAELAARKASKIETTRERSQASRKRVAKAQP